MARQFWFFTSDAGNTPHFPDGVVPLKASYVGAFKLLGTTASHAHLQVGGYARPDGRLSSAVSGYLHFHDLIEYGGEWYVYTTGTANHQHAVPDSPSWWLVSALIRNEDVAACAADATMYDICEIGEDGAISTETWEAAEQDQWEARMLAGLYLKMPSTVSNDDRLIAFVKNVAGLTGSERGYRCPGE